jgi:putative DNA primase/helicase
MFALKGLQRLIKQNKFTESIEVNNKLEEYKLDSNPVKQYMEEKYVKTDEENKFIRSSSMYDSYVVWCGSSGFMKLNNVNFGKELKRLKYNKKQKKIEGKAVWIYSDLKKK